MIKSFCTTDRAAAIDLTKTNSVDIKTKVDQLQISDINAAATSTRRNEEDTFRKNISDYYLNTDRKKLINDSLANVTSIKTKLKDQVTKVNELYNLVNEIKALVENGAISSNSGSYLSLHLGITNSQKHKIAGEFRIYCDKMELELTSGDPLDDHQWYIDYTYTDGDKYEGLMTTISWTSDKMRYAKLKTTQDGVEKVLYWKQNDNNWLGCYKILDKQTLNIPCTLTYYEKGMTTL